MEPQFFLEFIYFYLKGLIFSIFFSLYHTTHIYNQRRKKNQDTQIGAIFQLDSRQQRQKKLLKLKEEN